MAVAAWAQLNRPGLRLHHVSNLVQVPIRVVVAAAWHNTYASAIPLRAAQHMCTQYCIIVTRHPIPIVVFRCKAASPRPAVIAVVYPILFGVPVDMATVAGSTGMLHTNPIGHKQIQWIAGIKKPSL